jgi:hypothetical protein
MSRSQKAALTVCFVLLVIAGVFIADGVHLRDGIALAIIAIGGALASVFVFGPTRR